MKKVLLLCFSLSISLSFGQSVVATHSFDNMLEAPKTISPKSKKKSAYKNGLVSDYFSFYDLAMQWATASNFQNYVSPMMPDTTTTLYWYDGTVTPLGLYGNTGVGGLYDFTLPFWENPFSDDDQVTVDSVFIAGYYDINDGSQSDTLRVHIFAADTNSANSGLYGGIYFPGGTFSNYSNDIGVWTMDYSGNSSQGNTGNIVIPNEIIVDYVMSTTDSANSIHGIEIPNGFTMDADQTFGMYFEFIPGSYGFNDTVKLGTLDGTTNSFNVYYASDISNPQTGEFWSYSTETHMMTNLFAYAENRYGLYSGNIDFLNDYLTPSSRRMVYMFAHASGTSTMDVNEADLTSVAVFPNPSNGVVNVELNATTSATVKVVDVLGQVVYAAEENFVAGERKVIDLSNNAKGMYILSVEGNGVNTVERITIK